MKKKPEHKFGLSRRSFIGTSIGAAAGIGAAQILGASSASAQPPGPMGPPGGEAGGPPPGAFGPQGLFRAEIEINDCEVEGQIPSDLNGAFYRVGPDAQYPLNPRNIPFDGEGHVSMFRIKDGRVDYKTKYARTERWTAQDKAGKNLFPMYRNPYMDDPSVAGLSRSTANTHVINHKNMILALKEDSPPTALDLLTLETVVPNYTFDGNLPSETFTAHPKVDSRTGNIVAFGYEATGFGSDDVSLFEINPRGEIVWNAMVKVPYVGMLHDFAVTENHIIIYVIPLAKDDKQLQEGGIHWSWDGDRKTYFGIVRRDGDGSDMRWIEGPARSSTHVMGAFEDNGRVYVDCEMSDGNPFPFMPQKDGSPWNPMTGTSYITRLSAQTNGRNISGYEVERLYDYTGALPRQDDRYNTQAYSVGFLGTRDIHAASPQEAYGGYVRMDHAARKTNFWNAGPGTSLGECCFAPRSDNAPEGSGYLVGVANRQNEGGRGDLVILDAEYLSDGPVAVVKLPVRAVGQIHGWWVPESQMPQA